MKTSDNENFAKLNQLWLASDRHAHLLVADGWAGPKTQEAWRQATGFEPFEGLRSPWPVPDERSLIDFYGPPGDTQLVTIDLPYPMRLAWDLAATVTKTKCHRLIADSLTDVLKSILAHYDSLTAVQEARMDLYGGCYNKRQQRGGHAWSLHSWGAAIDLDPEQNSNLAKWPSGSTMPVAVIELFEAAGWKSGARAWGRDAMHFQATR